LYALTPRPVDCEALLAASPEDSDCEIAATDAPDLIMDPAPALNRVRMEAGAIGDTTGSKIVVAATTATLVDIAFSWKESSTKQSPRYVDRLS
jgi:hypothetical protein